MSGEKRCKNKKCNAPLPPGFEPINGLCTKCQNDANKAERMKEAANIISNIETAKIKTPSAQSTIKQKVNHQQHNDTDDNNAEPQTPSRLTTIGNTPKPEQVGDIGFNHLVAVKVSGEMLDGLKIARAKSGMPQAAYLRAILEDSISKYR